jgi:hypothetical protein
MQLYMPRELAYLNSTHWIKGSNQFRYSLGHNPRNFGPGSKISLSNLTIYNQTFNIEASKNNNTFSIMWLGVQYDFVMKDGYYTIDDINYYIQYCCLLEKLHVFQANGQPFYFIETTANAIRYSAQVNIKTIPTAANATTLAYTKPPGATWVYPSSQVTPQLILSPGLGVILGFQTNLSLPATVQSTNQSIFSDVSPQLSTVDCYIVTCNLLNSSMSVRSDIIAQVPLAGVAIGAMLQVNASALPQLDIKLSQETEITIQFWDQNLNALYIRDPSVSIILLIDY